MNGPTAAVVIFFLLMCVKRLLLSLTSLLRYDTHTHTHTHTHTLFLSLSYPKFFFICFTVFFSILMSVISLSLPHNHNIRTLLFQLTSDSNYHALMLSSITSNQSCNKKITIASLLKCIKKRKKKRLPQCSFTHMHFCAYL